MYYNSLNNLNIKTLIYLIKNHYYLVKIILLCYNLKLNEAKFHVFNYTYLHLRRIIYWFNLTGFCKFFHPLAHL